jgi:N-acetylglucosaminyldiphosphoundecaprenol N-acetyl-beta-D-mannosaminyltransferase
MEAQEDPAFKEILNSAAINTPDGMPLSWVGWLQGHKEMDRVYGPDFLLELCRLSLERGYRHFFYGGQEGVAQALAANLQERFPGLCVAGTYTPPFRPLTPDEEAELMEKVQSTRPDVFWVGLSTPKQERFMSAYVDRLNVPLMVGVGAAFDMHTGRAKDAPVWMKRTGLQWLHRLCQEPKRLGKRYLTKNPAFVLKVTRQLLMER